MKILPNGKHRITTSRDADGVQLSARSTLLGNVIVTVDKRKETPNAASTNLVYVLSAKGQPKAFLLDSHKAVLNVDLDVLAKIVTKEIATELTRNARAAEWGVDAQALLRQTVGKVLATHSASKLPHRGVLGVTPAAPIAPRTTPSTGR